MDKKIQKSQENVLLKLKERLNKKYLSLKKMSNFGESADDNAQEVSEASTNLSLEKDIETEIKAIDKALLAIKNDKYGICQTCKAHIESSRLKMVPTALRCSDCQGKIKSIR